MFSAVFGRILADAGAKGSDFERGGKEGGGVLLIEVGDVAAEGEAEADEVGAPPGALSATKTDAAGTSSPSNNQRGLDRTAGCGIPLRTAAAPRPRGAGLG